MSKSIDDVRCAAPTRRSALYLAAALVMTGSNLAAAEKATSGAAKPSKKQKPPATEHDHHDMASMGPDVVPTHVALVEAALHCVKTGDACFSHCVQALSSGETSMKECIRTVSSMLPMCTALADYAALDAKRLKDLARLCIDVCGDCRAECEKHKDHHATCKSCMESCAACIDECKKLIAA